MSSPCLERLREYKRERNVLINKETGLNTTEYIVKNFETLAVQFLDMNRYEFDELNVMEHPGLVIEKINKENLRSEYRVIYRYFTTVLYVALAYICGKTRQIDNYAEVREFLLSNVK